MRAEARRARQFREAREHGIAQLAREEVQCVAPVSDLERRSRDGASTALDECRDLRG